MGRTNVLYGYDSDEDNTSFDSESDGIESAPEIESRELTMKAVLGLSASIEKYPPPLSYFEEIADSFRRAIELDPKNSKAIYHLAKTYADYNIKITASDFKETRFVGRDPNKVRRSELVAELQRKALRIDPKDIYAIMQLAFAISNGVQIQVCDLEGTTFQDPFRVNPSEVEAALYRKVLAINPEQGEAYYYLGLLFEEESIEIQDPDRYGTKYATGHIDRIKLAAEYYRKVITLKTRVETATSACRHLAYCLKKGAPITKCDLALLKLDKTASVEEVMLALFRKAIATNPRDSVSLYHLASFILNGAKIEEVDFEGTTLVRYDETIVRVIDLAAAIYRKAITYNPKYYLAMQRLDACLKLPNGAQQEKEDAQLLEAYRVILCVQRLVARADTLYAHKKEPISERDLQAIELGEQDPSSMSREALITALYKRANFLDPNSIQAMLGLARCIEHTNSEQAALLYRRVISIEPMNSSAFYRLACCIGQRNIIIRSSDLNLLGAKFSRYTPDTINRDQLSIALLAQAVMLDPSDESLVKELKACLPPEQSVKDYLGVCGYKLQANTTYCPFLKAKSAPTEQLMVGVHTQNSTATPAKLK